MFSFFCVAQSCCFVNHWLSFCHFAFWPLCCQPFFDLKLLVTTLVTSSFDFNRLNGVFYLSFTNCTCCRWTDSDVKDLYVDVLIPTSKQWGNECLESDTNHHSQSAFALCEMLHMAFLYTGSVVFSKHDTTIYVACLWFVVHDYI